MSGIINCPSPNFDERSLPVTMLVLHYTGMQDGASAIARLTDPESRVSSHYIVAEDGQVLALVDEDKRAWHAGQSRWRGITDINSASVGIEMINPGHEWGYRPFPEAQMDALIPLIADIVERHGIDPANVVGHSDIAPSARLIPANCSIGKGWRRFAWRCRARAAILPIHIGRRAGSCWRSNGSAMMSATVRRRCGRSSAVFVPIRSMA